ncbi:GDSL-type esterase/lipase family protein [Alloiococcus sp. CFN-8]|uniref:GDSL-type esterase/lipase family protein n=1 Tax=Alloiococcus sp. CFN-8 TaxID=3416081 RepID=UPI003CE74FE0
MDKIICFGDSLVSGYGLQKGEGWCELLQKDYSISKNWTIINRGIPGDTITGLLSRSHRDVLLLRPKRVILLIGTNDLLLGRSVNVVFENLTFLISELISHNITPILLSPPGIAEDMAEESWDSYNNYSVVNKNIELLIKKLYKYSLENKIIFLNLYDFLHSLINMSIVSSYKDLYIDGIHLSSIGNSFIATKIKEILKV